MGFEAWNVASFRKSDALWLIRTLAAEICIEAKSQSTCLRSNDCVDRGVVILWPSEHSSADPLLVEFTRSPAESNFTNIRKKT
jgi:hypothetical protein